MTWQPTYREVIGLFISMGLLMITAITQYVAGVRRASKQESDLAEARTASASMVIQLQRLTDTIISHEKLFERFDNHMKNADIHTRQAVVVTTEFCQAAQARMIAVIDERLTTWRELIKAEVALAVETGIRKANDKKMT